MPVGLMGRVGRVGRVRPVRVPVLVRLGALVLMPVRLFAHRLLDRRLLATLRIDLGLIAGVVFPGLDVVGNLPGFLDQEADT